METCQGDRVVGRPRTTWSLPPLLVVNPTSGSNRAARDLPALPHRATRALGEVVVRETSKRGHARELAQEGARQGHGLVVAVGGDGTFSEVANGVLSAGVEDVSVGIINLGTGGDFRRSLGIEGGFEASMEALASGRERLIDVGHALFHGLDGRPVEHFFVNVLSAGLGGLVDRYIERMPAFIGGRAGYYAAALLAVAVSREQPVKATVTWETETREQIIPAYLIAVCNGRWFGGGMDVAPMARIDDDRLEVITVTARSKPYLADRVRGVYTGRHLQEPTVHHFPCRAISLRLEDEATERRFFLDVDGEALGTLPLEVKIIPRRLRVRG